MKNLLLIISLSVLVVFSFNSCSNENPTNEDTQVRKSTVIDISLKREVEKLVDLHCKAINILRKVDKGDRTALNRSNALRKEADQVSRELRNKYSSPDGQEQFSKAYQAALVNCPYQQ
ncbi:hypothetical protein [Brumimicrobium oceani]|uniref:Uncharacterized protein n=1 Tax=Brumimicrobium oceani TaxID=2100725 RepID=A0A2U2XBZ0_9FLAO|nr:hypothetical protein [Brumimicrobium oceani]PWH85287.1 hypothetical protein DIT68_10130 [Brumimicrobium oceani]